MQMHFNSLFYHWAVREAYGSEGVYQSYIMLVMVISNENVSKLTAQIIQIDKYEKYTTITKLTVAWMRQ